MEENLSEDQKRWLRDKRDQILDYIEGVKQRRKRTGFHDYDDIVVIKYKYVEASQAKEIQIQKVNQMKEKIIAE